MNLEKNRRRALLSWLFVSTLVVLCGILAVLQYIWLGEVSVAARDRLRGTLQGSLNRLSRDLNSEIAAACEAIFPPLTLRGDSTDRDLAERYSQWQKSNPHLKIFRRVALLKQEGEQIKLHGLDVEKGPAEISEWPAGWGSLKEQMEFRLSPERWERGRPPRLRQPEDNLVFGMPRLGLPGPPPGERFARFERRDIDMAVVELNPDFIRGVLIPELMQRHLGNSGSTDYQVEILSRADPSRVVYRSDSHQTKPFGNSADAAVGLLEIQGEVMRRFGGFGRRGPEGGPGEPPGGPMSVDVMTGGAAGAAGGRVRVGAGAAPVVVAMRGPGGGPGRWEMFVRHRAGSLEAVVSQARRRNLAVAGAVLLLMLASAGALMRYTRQAQKLAELQMDFVAGVSHELRTPLTVLRTAAYNLRGAVAQNPAQVERYGALIQQQTARLGDLVDQVLQFASAKAGRLVRDSEPVSVEALVEDSLAAVKPALESSRCVVEKSVAPDLPQVVGDRNALRQALENLLSNAVKYGTQGSDWIGISAARDSAGTVEIRVADRGPGIPASEQEQIFDPFFRGKRAIQEQIHGTGLGLSLAKETILAHGGTITVHSEPAKGTEFVIRIPVAPAEYRHEHAHTSG